MLYSRCNDKTTNSVDDMVVAEVLTYVLSSKSRTTLPERVNRMREGVLDLQKVLDMVWIDAQCKSNRLKFKTRVISRPQLGFHSLCQRFLFIKEIHTAV